MSNCIPPPVIHAGRVASRPRPRPLIAIVINYHCVDLEDLSAVFLLEMKGERVRVILVIK